MKMVIRGLTCLAQKAQVGTCEGCAYFRPFTDDPDTGWCDSVVIMSDAIELLKEQPDVVRCKDCKNYMTIHCTCDGCCISDDWFCADGERR